MFIAVITKSEQYSWQTFIFENQILTLLTSQPVEHELKSFISSANVILRQNPPESPTIRHDMDQLSRQWNTLNVDMDDHREKLLLAIEFQRLYKTVSDASKRFRISSCCLVLVQRCFYLHLHNNNNNNKKKFFKNI